MNPPIDRTGFGSITIAGKTLHHDVLIRLGGKVEKRKKELSKRVYGTSHLISLAEAEHIFEEGVQLVIVGTGQQGLVHLDDQAQAFFQERGCKVQLLPTPQAVEAWNETEGSVIGLFHVTC